jgi:hypothetical protein
MLMKFRGEGVQVPKMKFRGEGVQVPKIEIPGWIGNETSDSFQLWHLKEFTDAVSSGIEILYDGPDITLKDKIISPFFNVSDKFFAWQTNVSFKITKKHNLLIIPHSQYYVDPSMPLPLSSSIQYDWWPKKLVLYFCKKDITIFRNSQPVAQAIVVPRKMCVVDKMTEVEEKKHVDLESVFEKENVTRKWITKDGYSQDNLYAMMSRKCG